jgi:hypothetical protein
MISTLKMSYSYIFLTNSTNNSGSVLELQPSDREVEPRSDRARQTKNV